MNYSETKILRAIIPICLAILLAVPAAVTAQVTDERSRVETNLVLIDVLVMDRTGQSVVGLTADQFELFDNDTKQPIESFSADATPVSFGVVFDMHPTTPDRTRAVVESLREFARALGPDDDIFLAAFNMQGQQIFDFIPELDQLERHMADPAKREPRSLYDAVYLASDRIRSSRNQKRVLMIISDGADHNSRHSLPQLGRKLAGIRTEIYALIADDGFRFGYKDITHDGPDVYPAASDASPLDRAALLDLAAKSGGATYFGGGATAKRLQKIYTEIAREMRSHYTLGFYPDAIDGKSHRISVRFRDGRKNGFVLTYRRNYQSQVKEAGR